MCRSIFGHIRCRALIGRVHGLAASICHLRVSGQGSQLKQQLAFRQICYAFVGALEQGGDFLQANRLVHLPYGKHLGHLFVCLQVLFVLHSFAGPFAALS